MYNCRNCGGNLRFDIPSQCLKCPYCDSDYDCYEVEDNHTSQDEDSYDVTVFSCPQCGGEIVSSDQSVSEFCTYCGSSVVLDSRLRKEKRPQKIIPFKKTAQDCRNAYIGKLKGAYFAPSELKDPGFLEKFRGIYVPYWSYGFDHKGSVSLKSKHGYRSGDYDVTDYYNITGRIDASYSGICYDASSSFNDAISEAIAPFDPREMKDFVPSYLSGFYGDISDVPADTYIDEANDIANEATFRVIESNPVAGRYPISTGTNINTMNTKLGTKIAEPIAAMLPVWFLTWRSKDRVAYMTVNGQTGKVSADIPIDTRKYVLASLLFAIPLYFLLNALLSLRASTSLLIAGIFALVSGIIYYEEIRRIVKRDRREEDRGFQYTKREKAKQDAQKRSKEMAKGGNWIAIIAGASLSFSRSIIGLLLMAGTCVLWYFVYNYSRKESVAFQAHMEILGSQCAAILAAIICMIRPVSDVIYYIGMILAYLGIFATLIQIIRRYNLLITRPIPEFHNRGKEQP